MQLCRRAIVLPFVGLLFGMAAVGYWVLGGNDPPQKLTRNQKTSKAKDLAVDQPADFVYLTDSTYSRGGLIGVVLSTRFGLSRRELDALPPDFSREYFYKWLRTAEKSLETTALLRVPKLRSDRPSLDGQDIYDGFFALEPALLDFAAPLEGSISILKKQGFTFTEEELKALDAMLKASMGTTDGKLYRWHAFPVGSRILLQAGASTAVTIWINKGEQRPTIAETLAGVKTEMLVRIAISNSEQSQALNKHFNFSLEAKDELLVVESHGKYHAPREKLFDIVRQYRRQAAQAAPLRD
jgi:hypothetical protein